MESRNLTVAIDGPAGAGKSTVAREVAKMLGYLYIDTGAMYRAVTLYCLRKGIDTFDERRASAERPARSMCALCKKRAGSRSFSTADDVTEEIRRPEVGESVAQVARVCEVRSALVKLQRRMSLEGGVVMDGRDIGTVVLPSADLKVFLTASPEERAHRRYRELVARGRRGLLPGRLRVHPKARFARQFTGGLASAEGGRRRRIDTTG